MCPVSIDLERKASTTTGRVAIPPPLWLDGVDGEEAIPVPGPRGTPGQRGQQGIPGLDGESIDGLQGPPGHDGRDGRDALVIPGLDGQDGLDCIPIPGPEGIHGKPGADGAPGPPGADGERGLAGIGIDGLDGQDGLDGLPIRGPRGYDGVPGVGIRGQMGMPGFDGIDGLDIFLMPGPRGAKGAIGVGRVGPPGLGIDGEPGLDGFLPGPRGIHGYPGANGANGADGAPGRMGPPGMDGPEGEEQWLYVLLNQGGGVGIPDAIWDADMDTGIQVEEGADDDTVRFDVAGVEVGVWNNTGFDIESHVAIGSTGVLSPARVLTIQEVIISNLTKYGIYEDVAYAGAHGADIMYGQYVYVRYQGIAAGSSSVLVGLGFAVSYESGQALGAAYGVYGIIGSTAAGAGAWTSGTCAFASGSYAGAVPATAHGFRVTGGHAPAAVATGYGFFCGNMAAATSYLAELGPVTPYFRTLGGAAPGANLTNVWMNENGNLRRVQWIASDATGHVLPAGSRVMVLV